MPRINRIKHRNRTAVTVYLADDMLDIFESIVRVTDSTASSSELLQLAIIALSGQVHKTALAGERGELICSYDLLKKVVYSELLTIQSITVERFGESGDLVND
jgi:hypothetical protein